MYICYRECPKYCYYRHLPVNVRNSFLSDWIQLALRVSLFNMMQAMMVKVKGSLDYIMLV